MLIEVPVMLLVVRLVNNSRDWYEQGAAGKYTCGLSTAHAPQSALILAFAGNWSVKVLPLPSSDSIRSCA